MRINYLNNVTKNGLSGSAIKYIALVMMVFDHLHQMFVSQGIPGWFHWIGRPVLPVFLFMGAEAFAYTRSKGKYILRLFICYTFMYIGNFLFTYYMDIDNIELANNVFKTLFLSAFYMLCIDFLHDGIKEKNIKKIAGSVLLILLSIAAGLSILLLSSYVPYQVSIILFFIPNIFVTEGGITAVVLGVVFYLFRKKRLIQILIFSVFSILSFILMLLNGNGLFSGSPQWLMIFSVIFFILYNGKRGQGNKYFFYIFYPAHIYIFYCIAWFLK